jgi:hypothetical protein
VTLRTVRDGTTIFRFEAKKVAAATSQRAGAVRWSELVIYQLPSGEYVVSKIGRSLLAHLPTCRLIRPNMVTWLEAGEEGKIRRVPCLECNPEVGDKMDPQTVLESTRYTILRAKDREELRSVLAQGREHVPELIRRLLADV